MRVIEFQVVNFGRLVDRTLRFTPGLNVIVGSNGSGKSTTVDGMLAALTGDFAGPGVKEDHVRTSAGPRDKSFVRVVLEHAGTVAEVKRSLRPNGRSLTVGGKPVGRTEAEVNEALWQLLGTTKPIICDYAFVRQWETAAVLSASPSRRLAVLNRLFRVDQADRVYRLVTDRLTASDQPVDVSDERLSEASRAASAAGDQVLDLSSRLADLPASDACRRVVDAYRRYERVRDEATRTRERLDQVTAQAAAACRMDIENAAAADTAAALLGRLVEEVDRAKPDADEAAVVLNEWRTHQAAAGVYAAAVKRRERAEERLRQLGPEPPLVSDDEYNTAVAAREQARAAFTAAALHLSRFPKHDGPCPTCGSEPTNALRDSKRQAEEESLRLHLLVAPAEQVVFGLSSARTVRSNWVTAQAEVLPELNAVLPPVPAPPVVPLESCQVLIRAYADLEARRSAAHGEVTRLRAKASELTDSRSRLEAARVELTAKLESITLDTASPPSDDQYREAVQALADRSSLESQLTVAEQVRDSAEAAAAELARLRASADGQRDKVRHLRKLKAVLTPTGLPAAVVGRCLSSLGQAINRKLEQFGSPFTVAVGEQASLTVTSPDGNMSADRLSGGQKMVLGLAFRLCVLEELGRDFGFLCLDEPTVGLDADNRGHLTRCMTEVSRAARAGGTQIVVVTHDRQLAAAADTVIDLSGD